MLACACYAKSVLSSGKRPLAGSLSCCQAEARCLTMADLQAQVCFAKLRAADQVTLLSPLLYRVQLQCCPKQLFTTAVRIHHSRSQLTCDMSSIGLGENDCFDMET